MDTTCTALWNRISVIFISKFTSLEFSHLNPSGITNLFMLPDSPVSCSVFLQENKNSPRTERRMSLFLIIVVRVKRYLNILVCDRSIFTVQLCKIYIIYYYFEFSSPVK